MKRSSLFGSHLYSQIVAPLLIALVVVGTLATAAAVYFLRDLTGHWIEQQTKSSTESVVRRHDELTRKMQYATAFAASNAELSEAAATGEPEQLQLALQNASSLLGFDGMMLLDADSRLVAHYGTGLNESAERPLGRLGSVKAPKLIFDTMDKRHVLAAINPLPAEGNGHVLVAYQFCDDALLMSLGGGDLIAIGLFTGQMEPVATSVGSEYQEGERQALINAITEPSPQILKLFEDAGDLQGSAGVLSVEGTTYKTWIAPIYMPGDGGEDVSMYALGAVSQAVSQRAGATATNVIMLWSVAVVIGLVGLGGWVARRVSEPLAALSAGAQRIADGDYGTKVDVRGSNEIAELAGTFNLMTDSLKDRSDSLTKKVLELATLYEMSRSLGSTLEMEPLLSSVLSSALRIFDLETGYVTLRDPDTGELSILATAGPVNVQDSAAVHSSMSEWVIREGRPLIFNPDPASGKTRVDAITGARAALCVPLVSSEGTIGSITVGSHEPDYRFSSDDVRLLSTIANHVTIAVGNIELFSSRQDAYLATVRSLAAAVDAKDRYTRGHSDKVALYAVRIAERIGLSQEQVTSLEMAAYLHDIGKIGVREDILLKPGVLDEAEMRQMRHHPLIGANILQPVAFPWPITPIVRHHHEFYDGSGYPAGLRGDEIPLLARILTAADSFEAMTSDRPYRAGRTTEDAIEELRRYAGIQFDPGVVEAFIEVLEELQIAGEPLDVYGAGRISVEEARGVFSALAEGLLESFRQLGGARLGSNVEQEIDAHFANAEMPFRLQDGSIHFLADEPAVVEDGDDDERGVFSELVEGLLETFRQLGDPRLGSSVEQEIEAHFAKAGMPFRLQDGAVRFLADEPAVTEAQVEEMRAGLRTIEMVIGRLSGTTLVDHFYAAAMEGLSERMRDVSDELCFFERG
jgi:putative nucleotidyltransferase with HDIG domain